MSGTLFRVSVMRVSCNLAGLSCRSRLRFRIRTTLYAAQAKVNTQSTLKIPRWRTFRSNAIVFSHPKHSSMRFLFC